MNSKLVLCLTFCATTVLFAQATVKKVSSAEAKAAIASKVMPSYPAMAKQMKIEGTVELEATVTEDGKVSQVNIVSGNPLLTRAGVEALKLWKFTPFKDDGKPVTAIAPISINFHLGGAQ